MSEILLEQLIDPNSEAWAYLKDLRTIRQVAEACPALRGRGKDPTAPIRGLINRADENGLAESGALVRIPGQNRIYIRLSAFARWIQRNSIATLPVDFDRHHQRTN